MRARQLLRRVVLPVAIFTALGLDASPGAAAPPPKKNSPLCLRARETFRVLESFENLKLGGAASLDVDKLSAKLLELHESLKKLELRAPVAIQSDLKLARELLDEIKKSLPAIKPFLDQARKNAQAEKGAQAEKTAKRQPATNRALAAQARFQSLEEKARSTKPALDRLVRFFSSECGLK